MTPAPREEGQPKKPFTLKVVRGSTPVIWIGQIVEIPGILVQAENREKLLVEAAKSLALYATVFPESMFDEVPSSVEVS